MLSAEAAAAFWPFENSAETKVEDSAPAINLAPVESFAYVAPTVVLPKPTVGYTQESKIGYVNLPIDGNGKIRGSGQCVFWVRHITGVEYTGDAKYWARYVTHDTPNIGDIIVINIGRWGHVGVVKSIDETEGKMTVRSRNMRGLYIVSDDEFNIADPAIAGYIKVK